MIGPFTIATGVAGILGLSIEVTILARKYISGVKSTPKEVDDLIFQTNALGYVLEKLREFLRNDAAEHIIFQPNSGLSLILKSCEKQLESLYKKLQVFKETDKSRFMSVLDRLIWPLDKQECVEAIRCLHECTQTFHFCLTMANWFVF